jgi:hypothetical protein
VTFEDALHLLGMDVTFGAFIPLEEMMLHSFCPLLTHVWILRGCFDVLAFYLYFRGYFGGWLETYPPCIMDYYVFRGF